MSVISVAVCDVVPLFVQLIVCFSMSPEDVTLNPVTAYPFLILSEDRKQVKRGEKLQFYRNSSQRFDVWSCVTAKEGFGTGRHYWEVRVVPVLLVPPVLQMCNLPVVSTRCRCLLGRTKTGSWAWSASRPRGKACLT